MDQLCHRCARIIHTSFVTVNKRYYHEHCFTCAICDAAIQDADHLHDACLKEIYCSSCFQDHFARALIKPKTFHQTPNFELDCGEFPARLTFGNESITPEKTLENDEFPCEKSCTISTFPRFNETDNHNRKESSNSRIPLPKQKSSSQSLLKAKKLPSYSNFNQSFNNKFQCFNNTVKDYAEAKRRRSKTHQGRQSERPPSTMQPMKASHTIMQPKFKAHANGLTTKGTGDVSVNRVRRSGHVSASSPNIKVINSQSSESTTREETSSPDKKYSATKRKQETLSTPGDGENRHNWRYLSPQEIMNAARPPTRRQPFTIGTSNASYMERNMKDNNLLTGSEKETEFSESEITESDNSIAKNKTSCVQTVKFCNSRNEYPFNTPTGRTEAILICPLCYYELLNTSLENAVTKCGHIFHKDCIDCWLSSGRKESRGKCPTCFEICSEDMVYPVHMDVNLSTMRNPDNSRSRTTNIENATSHHEKSYQDIKLLKKEHRKLVLQYEALLAEHNQCAVNASITTSLQTAYDIECRNRVELQRQNLRLQRQLEEMRKRSQGDSKTSRESIAW